MRKFSFIAAICFMGSVGLISNAAAKQTAKSSTAVSTIFTAPKEGSTTVSLLIAGGSKAVDATVNDNATMGGICRHCGMPLRFKPANAGKVCDMCPCGDPMTECIAWIKLKHNDWQEMLRALPAGTGLQVAFKTAGNPASGISRLIVDRRVVLLPIESKTDPSDSQILKWAKPLGGTKVNLLNGGKQVEITLKSDWTGQKEAKLAKDLNSLGIQIAFKSDEVASQ